MGNQKTSSRSGTSKKSDGTVSNEQYSPFTRYLFSQLEQMTDEDIRNNMIQAGILTPDGKSFSDGYLRTDDEPYPSDE